MRRALAAIAAALAVLAGCGGEKRETVPVEDLVAAVDQTRAAPSERVHMEITMSAPGLDEPIDFTGDGTIENKTRSGRLTLDMSELLPFLGAKTAAGDGIMQEVVDGFTVYVRWAPLTKQLGADKEWLKFDLQKAGEQQGFDLGALSGGQGGDPTQQLDQLRAASDGVEVGGQEKVRGADTTHYKASVDLERYPDVARMADRERVRQSVERLIELTGQKKIPTEVWIAHDSKRIVKTRVKTRTKVPQGVTLETDLRMELYDFGVDVGDVKPPPPEDTADVAELSGGSSP
jgi:hypothetical protein